MNRNQMRRDAALNKELAVIAKQEKRMVREALKAKPARWKTEPESCIPKKVYAGPEGAFCKGFGLVFNLGRAIIEKAITKKSFRQTMRSGTMPHS